MAEDNLMCTFVGQKISKVLWCRRYDGTIVDDEFITGAFDEDRNFITKWKVSTEDDCEPSAVGRISIRGSVTDMGFMTPTQLLCCSSNGDVTLLSMNAHTGEIFEKEKWSRLHRYNSTDESACCTCVASYDQQFATGGEDGKINLLLPDRKTPMRTLDKADSSNITGLKYLSSNELVSINSTGQMKLWDIRQPKLDEPQKTLTLSGNACPLLSLDKHPNQPHIVVTGHGDGVIGIWDVRQELSPVTLIDAHADAVWQVKFHPLYPDNLFTCSEDGSCWFWDGTSMINEATYMKASDSLSNSIWLYIDANKHKMETFSLIPSNRSAINAFDVNGASLVCATDNEAIILVSDIPVR